MYPGLNECVDWTHRYESPKYGKIYGGNQFVKPVLVFKGDSIKEPDQFAILTQISYELEKDDWGIDLGSSPVHPELKAVLYVGEKNPPSSPI
jgi:hypothetical protein